MAYPDVISRRLEILIERLVGRQLDVSMDPKLGEAPLGFDGQGLVELRSRINGNDGFADVLAGVIPADQVKVSMKFSALVALIVQKSTIQTLEQYESKQRERVRLGLRQALAEMANPPIDPMDVLPTDLISKFLAPGAGAVAALRDRLNAELRKYLLTQIRSVDLNGTVRRANELIVARMLA